MVIVIVVVVVFLSLYWLGSYEPGFGLLVFFGAGSAHVKPQRDPQSIEAQIKATTTQTKQHMPQCTLLPQSRFQGPLLAPNFDFLRFPWGSGWPVLLMCSPNGAHGTRPARRRRAFWGVLARKGRWGPRGARRWRLSEKLSGACLVYSEFEAFVVYY